MIIVERKETNYGAYVPDVPGCVAVAESKEGYFSSPGRAAPRKFTSEGTPIPGTHTTSEWVEIEV